MHSIRVAPKGDVLLDVLSIIARRPSPNCAHRSPQRTPTLRRSSTTTNPHRPTKLSPSTTPSKPSSTPPTPPKVPLRMLLDRNPANTSAISKIPIPKGERGEKFTPSPLSRPIGLPYPPRPGQNAPHSDQRRKSFLDPENVQTRRRLMVRSLLRPYFQEWKRLEHFKGKSFVGVDRLFRRERALWFPNLWGWTLARDGAGGRDTTPVLRGRVSLVGVQSGVWAEEQVRTFLGEKENPELARLVAEREGVVQRVTVNVQDHWFRALMVKMFKYKLRKSRPEKDWGKYFSVRLGRDTGKGLTEDVRDAMGLLNSQVGYVYLLDTDCRIRWAGSGHAWEGETKSLNAGVKRLIEEAEVQMVPAKRPMSQGESIPEGDLQADVERALA